MQMMDIRAIDYVCTSSALVEERRYGYIQKTPVSVSLGIVVASRSVLAVQLDNMSFTMGMSFVCGLFLPSLHGLLSIVSVSLLLLMLTALLYCTNHDLCILLPERKEQVNGGYEILKKLNSKHTQMFVYILIAL